MAESIAFYIRNVHSYWMESLQEYIGKHVVFLPFFDEISPLLFLKNAFHFEIYELKS